MKFDECFPVGPPGRAPPSVARPAPPVFPLLGFGGSGLLVGGSVGPRPPSCVLAEGAAPCCQPRTEPHRWDELQLQPQAHLFAQTRNRRTRSGERVRPASSHFHVNPSVLPHSLHPSLLPLFMSLSSHPLLCFLPPSSLFHLLILLAFLHS